MPSAYARWWLTATLTLLPAWMGVWSQPQRAYRSRAVRGLHALARSLGLVTVMFPGLHHLARGTVRWLYFQGPEALTRLLMPSRAHLPLEHYLKRLEDLLFVGFVGAWAVAAFALFTLKLATAADPLKRTLPRRLRIFAGLLAVSPFLWFLGLQVAFRLPHPVFYTDCRKVWGHRGHPEPGIPENTLASFRHAFDLGAPGVEMDVVYLVDQDRFFIAREMAQVNEQRLSLETVFAQLGHRGYFWLDIKSIRSLTPDQAQRAAATLRRLAERYRVTQRIIVESDHPQNLAFFSQAGLHTSYWIFNIEEEEAPQSLRAWVEALMKVQRNYIRGRFSAISMDYHHYKPIVARFLQGARIHLFTVNDEALLRAFMLREDVRIVLTDGNFFRLTACP